MNNMNNLFKPENFTIKMIKKPIKTFSTIYTMSLNKKTLN